MVAGDGLLSHDGGGLRRRRCGGLLHRRHSRADDPSRIATLGLGHGVIDSGGYTYLNPASGRTFSEVAGLTYNFKYPDTQVQSGVDFHFDWNAA
jgi:hypothetical protein